MGTVEVLPWDKTIYINCWTGWIMPNDRKLLILLLCFAELEASKKQAEQDKKAIDELVRERDILNKVSVKRISSITAISSGCFACQWWYMLMMGECKKDVIPVLMHWSYVFLSLTHRYSVGNLLIPSQRYHMDGMLHKRFSISAYAMSYCTCTDHHSWSWHFEWKNF